MQPSEAIEPPSVQATAQALERLRISEELRDDVLPDHTYPDRDRDLETVYTFVEAFGELPPENYLKRLWWFWRS